jgi:DNA replication and repair protein RecF
MQMVSDNDFGQVFITDTSANRVRDIFSKIGVEVKLFNVAGGEIDA